jgi:hypothetical protein
MDAGHAECATDLSLRMLSTHVYDQFGLSLCFGWVDVARCQWPPVIGDTYTPVFWLMAEGVSRMLRL